MRQLEITTSDQVTFHLVAAGLPTRTAAWLVDQAFLTVIRLALLLVLSAIGMAMDRMGVTLIMVLDLIYFTYYEWLHEGRTPGKQRFRLRVVSSDGARLTPQAVVVRNIVRLLDLLPLMMLTGGIAAFFDPLGRRLGDLAAGTMVIRERAAAFSLPPADRDRPNTFQENPGCRRRILSRANRDDRDLAVELMWRREELDPEARRELFRRLAGEFTRRFSLPEEAGLSDEQIVLDVALILMERDA